MCLNFQFKCEKHFKFRNKSALIIPHFHKISANPNALATMNEMVYLASLPKSVRRRRHEGIIEHIRLGGVLLFKRGHFAIWRRRGRLLVGHFLIGQNGGQRIERIVGRSGGSSGISVFDR